MRELLERLEYLEDGRQQSKVRYPLKDIWVIMGTVLLIRY